MPSFSTAAANDNHGMARRDEWVEALVQSCAGLFNDETVPFSGLEKLLLDIANELVRRGLEQALQARSDRFGQEVVVVRSDGESLSNERYRRHHRGTARYHSLCGPLEVRRWTYRLVGERNGPTIVPVEWDAGLIAHATPALAYALAKGHATAPIRDIEQGLHAAHRCPPSCSTMDRVGRNVGQEMRRLVPVLEPVVRAEETLPEGAHAVNIGLDRTTIPMEEPGSKSGKGARRGRKAKSNGTTKKASRKAKRIDVCYRMAYVGTVCITDRAGNVLCAWRYAASAHEGPSGLVQRMIADVNRALEQRTQLKLGVVQDGAPEMWNLLREALEKNPATKDRPWRETVDRYHFLERVAAMLEVLYPKAENAQKRKQMLDAWRRQIAKSDRAPKRIHDWLERESLRQNGGHLGKKGLWGTFDRKLGCYMLRQDHFRYASLAHDGLHSGSGVTEGACKFLVTARTKRSGQRWSKRGVDAVLSLRSLLASERLDAVWSLFALRHQAQCANAA